ncbi:MAG: 2-amino-4-hydroxy-6-hydroxymethyldihydropteridine diphosphokinase [Acidobacteria bacterium]|nr:2-amino-4-hydroxy-6-hydroxymethyldihydropteridine diphosphokinase [Acidobacteriota bacterium]
MKNACAISLGSNKGDSRKIIKNVIDRFNRDKIFEVVKISSLYYTEPVETFPQPYFYNLVIMGKSSFNPLFLLKYFLGVEKDFGRNRTKTKGERTIDIDLLFYEKISHKSNFLTIPHPSLLRRKCVLLPLKEIAPRWRHPETKMTISQILSNLGQNGDVKKLEGSFSSEIY